MANEIGIPGITTGLTTAYAMVYNSVNQVWSTVAVAFVAYATADRANYDVALTEQGTASGRYVGDFPSAIAAGVYSIAAYNRVGGAPAEGDTYLGGTGGYQWSGTAEQALYRAPVNVDQIKTQTVTCAAGVTVGSFVGNSTAAILVDGSGQVTAASVQGNVTGNVVGSVANVTGAVGSVAGNVGGNVVGSVASVVADVNANLVTWIGVAPLALTSQLVRASISAAPTLDVNVVTWRGVQPASLIAGNVSVDVQETAATLTFNLVGSVGSVSSTVSANVSNITAVADGLLDLVDGIETGFTVRQTFRLLGASIGTVTGAPVHPLFRNLANNKTRLDAVCDENGNRTVTFDAT